MQIQISWLLQKPADLDLHCLQRQAISRVGLGLIHLVFKIQEIFLSRFVDLVNTRLLLHLFIGFATLSWNMSCALNSGCIDLLCIDCFFLSQYLSILQYYFHQSISISTHEHFNILHTQLLDSFEILMLRKFQVVYLYSEFIFQLKVPCGEEFQHPHTAHKIP